MSCIYMELSIGSTFQSKISQTFNNAGWTLFYYFLTLCYSFFSKNCCYDLAAAGNKSATRPPLPPTGCGGAMERNRQKPVGRDKGILTEQQTKGMQQQQYR